jgi:hypothetical protein
MLMINTISCTVMYLPRTYKTSGLNQESDIRKKYPCCYVNDFSSRISKYTISFKFHIPEPHTYPVLFLYVSVAKLGNKLGIEEFEDTKGIIILENDFSIYT